MATHFFGGDFFGGEFFNGVPVALLQTEGRGNWNLLKQKKKYRRIRYSDYESQEAYAAELALAAMPIARVTDTSEQVFPVAGVTSAAPEDDDDDFIIKTVVMQLLYDR